MHKPVSVDEVDDAIDRFVRGGPVPPGRPPQSFPPTPSEVMARMYPEADLAAARGRSAGFAEASVRLGSGEATVDEDGSKWLTLDLSEASAATPTLTGSRCGWLRPIFVRPSPTTASTALRRRTSVAGSKAGRTTSRTSRRPPDTHYGEAERGRASLRNVDDVWKGRTS